MKSNWVFDDKHYDELNLAREAVVQQLIPEFKRTHGVKTVADVGCGLGHYSALLSAAGFSVTGFDAREENIAEARRRYSDLTFHAIDAEDPRIAKFGKFDLIFCFGLLYHLENPLRVIRNLLEMMGTALFIEGIVYPSPEPVLVLMDENEGEDQGVHYLAYYPSEAALVKMFRRTGLEHCYLPQRLPDHPEYQAGRNNFRRRTVLVASAKELNISLLVPYPHPSPHFDPWKMVPLKPIRGIPAQASEFVDRVVYKLSHLRSR